jgi:hypothetical protein
MAAKPEKYVPPLVETKPIFFTCKFCGETKPLEELTIIRRYYPQLTACSECARNKNSEETAATPEKPAAE